MVGKGMMKPPGLLNESVAFDAPVYTPDGSGGQSRTWAEQWACRAQFIYSRGSEVVDAARLSGRATYKVKARLCDEARAITTEWRMRDVRRAPLSGVGSDTLPGTRYNIREVDAITDRRWVYLVVEAGAPV